MLGFFEDPLLEVDEIEGMRVLYFFCLQPLDEKREMVRQLLPVEDPIYHMATKQTHLDLVASVRVDLPVLVDRLEDVRGRRTVGKLQLVECSFVNCQLITFLEILYWHVLQHNRYLTVGIFEHQVSLHVLLLHLRHELLVFRSLGALQPLASVNFYLSQAVRHFPRGQLMNERVGKEDIGFEEVKLSSQPFRVRQVGCIVIKELRGALFQVLHFGDFEGNFLQLSF